MIKSINNGQKKFEKVIVDFDKYLFTAAKFVEKTTVVVHNKKTKEEHEFENISTFWGLGKEPKGLLGVFTRLLGVKSPKSDWEIREKVTLRDDLTNHLEEAKKQISYSVGVIKNLDYADDYILCIGGEANFRYDIATIQPYKGNRKDKPILFEELRSEFIKQYKNKINIAEGWEADDTLGMFAAQNQANFKKTGKYKYLLSYVDKDLRQLWGPAINPDKLDNEIIWIEPLEAALNLGKQLLMGDKGTDNIPGIGGIADITRDKYKFRKTNSCGEATASAILKGCEDIKEVFQRVVDTYKEYYNEDDTKWREVLNENFRLLFMLRTRDINVNIFDILLDRVGVVYE